MCFCVLYHSHNKQWLCPWTPLNGWSLQWLQTVFSVTRNWSFIYNGDVCVSVLKRFKLLLVFLFSTFHFLGTGSVFQSHLERGNILWQLHIYNNANHCDLSTVARGWLRSYKALWRVFIHVYYSTTQKQMIQCMKLSQPCWLKLKCYVMWCLVGQSLVTDDSQEIITSTLKIVFLDCPEDAVSRIVWNITNYWPTDIVSYTRLL
jgi:hypothetical protein